MTKDTPLLAGVIGSPIGHSLSPHVHGFWLQKYGIDGYYIPIELSRDSFAAGLKSLPKLGFRGVNITLPFKETALALADVISDRAALIGAANTLTFRRDGRLQADNTDGYGFIANIRQQVPGWSAKTGPAMVLGAGGASRAIISALLEDGAPELWLSNRTKNRAEMLREHFGAKVRVVDWVKAAGELGGCTTLVNTTSLGMAGQPELPISLEKIKPDTLVTDIVYSPLVTNLLASAGERGCVTVDGLGMLLHQAVPGFESWFRKRPSVDQELRDRALGL
jgi:shikimate dehydrogenase